MSTSIVSVASVGDAAFADAELLLDGLDLAEEALVHLAQLASIDEEALRTGDGWAARVELDGTAVLVRAEAGRWALYAADGADAADAMLAARKIHGLVGERDPGWDLDR